MRGAVSLNGKELVWQAEALEVTPPSVAIGTRDAKLEQGKQFQQLSQFTFAKVSAERKLPFTRLAKPVFTVRETSLRPVRMELLDKARQESFQRLNQKMRVTP